MDIARMWRSMRADPAAAPHAGTRLETEGPGITISVTQECQIALPPQNNRIPAVSVTVTSQRPGMAAQVSIAANFNTPDGNYQGPTTRVGQGQFTATDSLVQARFILLPSGFPLLGVGAFADWADGTQSGTLTYEQIACDPWVWWGWLTPVASVLSRPLSAIARLMPPRG
jgi:hypothetical protein